MENLIMEKTMKNPMENPENEAVTEQTAIKPASRRKKFAVERVMIALTLFFILGVALQVVIPGNAPYRSLVMIAYMVGVVFYLYRFGV